MILSGHQPNYLPWIGYFHKVSLSDKHILVDNVQYNKKHVTNRNKIKTPEGSVFLTVPVLTKGKFYQQIDEVRINNNEPWSKKHWKALNYYYVKTPFFKEYIGFFKGVYSQRWDLLVDLNIYILDYLFDTLGIRVPILRASEEGITGKKNELIVNLVKETGCDTYLSGSGARKYMDEEFLASKGIDHTYQDFHHPTYPQMFGEFLSNMSVIDLLFNTGPEAKNILTQCGNTTKKYSEGDGGDIEEEVF